MRPSATGGDGNGGSLDGDVDAGSQPSVDASVELDGSAATDAGVQAEADEGPADAGSGQDSGVGADAGEQGCVVEGGYTIENNLDVQAIVTCSEITGDLIIESSTLSGVSLPVLRRVGHGLLVRNSPALAPLSLPKLGEVEGDLDVRAPLTTLTLNSLQEVGGQLQVVGTVIPGLSLPKLTATASLNVSENAKLTHLELGVLAITSATLRASGNALLESIALPMLQEAGGITVTDNPKLPSLDLWLLRSGAVVLYDNATLASVQVAALTEGEVRIRGNPQLTAISLPLLSEGSVNLTSSALSMLSLPAY